MAVKGLDIIGTSKPILLEIGEDDKRYDDFIDVPNSDHRAHRRGESYQDRGTFGSYQTNGGRQFDQPSDRFDYAEDAYGKTALVWGANSEDFQRGYVEPAVREPPQMTKANYEMRSTSPRFSDGVTGGTDFMPDDFEFRRRNQRSRGFLTRPRIPTER